jgi:peptide/nickel transport system ATP-binding protein
VEAVSLQVRAGETLSIVGESGSGKTTLLNAILGLAPMTQGARLLEGRAYDPAAARDGRLQVVFQDPRSSLNPRWPVWRLVTEPMTVAGPMSVAARKAAASALLEQVGLDPRMADRAPAAFSGGQRQRIAIARAIAREPKVLLLDEPTSALDVSAQAQILDLLAELQAAKGLAYIFVSHDLNVVRCISDRIAVMRAGQIVETGDAEQIFNRPGHPYTQALLAATLTLPTSIADPTHH